jgi:hypothetical protein
MDYHAFLRCSGLVMVSSLALAACGGQDPDPAAIGGVAIASAAEAVNGAAPYPDGPYGTDAGSVIPNYKLTGFPNPQVDSANAQTIRLSDFYNPHADDPSYEPESPAQDDRLYPPGSPYGGGTPKPKALAIDIASVWCGPCNNEAKSILPGKRAHYRPMGGEILIQLDDGPHHGTSATVQDLRAWTQKYAVDFPATIDPDRQLDDLFVAPAYPTNAIIDTRTMTIVHVIAGTPGSDYWQTFESVISGD